MHTPPIRGNIILRTPPPSQAIQTQTDEVLVYCGCGDGKVKILRGLDQNWTLESEHDFPFPICGLSMNADNTEVIIASHRIA